MIFRRHFDAPFRNRRDAGRKTADALLRTELGDDVIVLALPRGGVPVGYEVARAIKAPLYALVVRKLGAPTNPELAIGAIASDGTVVLDQVLLGELGVSDEYVDAEIARQRDEIDRRLSLYGRSLEAPDVEGRTVVLVDDGVATGSTTLAAIQALRARKPAAIVLAVPVGSRDVLARLELVTDRVVAVEAPERLLGVGAWYDDFSQVPDEEVVQLLEAGLGDS
jgi:putative phosphoribosyl transferase